MALRSVMEIDVRDDAFKAFAENFKKYQEALGKTPEMWGAAGEEIKTSGVSFQKLVAALLAQSELTRKVSVEQRSIGREAERADRSWQSMARSTKDVAGNIANMTRSLLRWASLTTVFSGLLGVGGLFGIERLAQNAGNIRRSSLGLGVSPGEQRSFELNYGRLVEPGQFLSSVNTGQHDIGSQQFLGLLGAGFSQKQIQSGNTVQLSADLIDHLKKIVDATDPRLLGPTLHARNLDQFIGLDEAQRLRNTRPGEIAQYRRDLIGNRGSLDLTPGQAEAWQKFQVQLHRAGEQIEAVLERRLVGLAGPLGHLSDSFQHLVDSALKSPLLEEWINKLAHGIDWLGTNLDTPEFKASVAGFIKDVGEFVKGVGEFAGSASSFFSWLRGRGSDDRPDGGLRYKPDRFDEKLLDWLKKHDKDAPVDVPSVSPMNYNGAPSFQNLVHQAAFRQGGGQSAAFDYIEAAGGLPAGLLSSVRQAESGGNDNAVSRAGAMGPFQFMPGTWARYGRGGNPFNLADSTRAAGSYLGDLMREFRGDIAKAVAAYNWGEKNVEKDVARWGNDWRNHLPRETQGYLNKVLPGVGIYSDRGRTWAVNVYNHTGGNAIISAAQLAA